MHHRTSLVAAAVAALAPHALAQQPTWTQITPPSSPPARWQHQTSYDLGRNQVVVFGGRWTSNYNADTWEFDGATWTQRTPAVSPPGRQLGAMCYDWVRAQTVLFGGMNPGLLGDTWLWDGTSWTQATPSNSPSARRQHAMAYDSARNVVVLFGGTYNNDTWEWDGTDWTQIVTANAPAGRNTRMAYDSRRGVMVIHGGDISVNVYDGETWEFDGSDWTQRFPANSPGVRVGASIEYDQARQRIVLFGGFNQAFQNLGDTWEWDGYDWTEITPTVSPTPRRGFDNSVYDLQNSRVLMFGGYPGGVTDEIWVFDGSSDGVFTVYGPDCPPASGAVTFGGSTPNIGQQFDVTFGNLGAATGVIAAFGTSDTTWSGVALPFDLAPIGLPGCDLRTSADVLELAVQSGGAATYGWTLPNTSSIYGAQFFCQGLVLDLSAGLTFTGATGLGRARVGS